MCDFTFKHYREVLETACHAGYQFYTHHEYWQDRPTGPSVLLRHDIDNYLRRSVEFARIEASLGIRATYFVRIHGEYNVFHVNDYLRLKEIRSLGHEIGLHSDVVEFGTLTGESECLEDLFRREIRYLETALGVQVRGVATHRDFNDAPNSLPYVSSLDLREFGLEYDAYHPAFVQERKYLSEKVNRGIGWWDKCFCRYIDSEPQLTVLTHPRWWFHNHFYED
jgi:hypothetical protein